MANKKITELPAVTSLTTATDVVVCVASNTTSKITIDNMKTSMNIGDTTVTGYTSTSTNPGANEYIEFTNTSQMQAGQVVKVTQGVTETYHLVTNVDTASSPERVYLSGPNLSNGVVVSSIKIVPDSKTVPIDVLFSGSYCISHSAGTDSLIADENKTSLRWTQTNARLVYVAARSEVVDGGASYADINVAISGSGVFTTSVLNADIELNTAASWIAVPAGGIDGAQNQVTFGDEIEIRLTDNGTDGDSQDLTVSLVFAVED